MDEIFKQIENSKYCISNFGRIKNMKTQKILKQYTNSYGYNRLSLYINEKKHEYLVHRLVAIYFLSPIINKTNVNHKDENKLNNNVINLEYVTQAENIKYYYLKRKNNIQQLTNKGVPKDIIRKIKQHKYNYLQINQQFNLPQTLFNYIRKYV